MADNQIQQVKAQTDIVSIISERIKLTPAGRSLKANCPFHSEKSPSFFVTPEMQLYKCFGCGASGDVINFLQQYDGLTFPEVLETLAKKAGITLKKGYKTPDDNKRDRLLEIMHLTTEYFHYLLLNHPAGQDALAYAKKRGIHQATIKTFKIGYAPNSWQALGDYLTKKKNYSTQELIDAGLSIQNQKNPDHTYDRFRHRIMFPLTTTTGQVIGFSGRLLESIAKDSPGDKQEAKYINSPETTLYHKSKHLFGIQQAKRNIHQKKRVIVVEGELDVISSHQVNVKEIVAVKGTGLTAEHLTQLKRLTSTILLALDSDSAGQTAMVRTINLAEGHELNLRVIPLTNDKDPDDLIRADPQAWKDLIKQSQSIYDFHLNLALKRFDISTGSGQKQLMQFLVPVFSGIQNSVEQAFYVKKLAGKLSVSETAITAEINKFRRRPQTSYSDSAQADKSEDTPKLSGQELLEHFALTSALHLQQNASDYLQAIDPDWFTITRLKNLVQKLTQLAKDQNANRTSTLIKKLPENFQTLINELYTLKAGLLEQTQEEVIETHTQAIDKLKNTALKRQLVDLGKQLTQKDLSSEERTKIQATYHQLSRQYAQRKD